MGELQHAPFEALVETAEWQAGRRTAGSDSWSDHIAGCEGCSHQMRELVEIMETLRAGDAGDAPDTWIHRAVTRAVPRHYRDPIRGEFGASVLFDSARERPTGTRSDALAGHQFVLASDRLEIEVSLSAPEAGERWPLTGQLFAMEGAEVHLGDCRVVLVEGGNEREQVRTTPAGDFVLTTRPLGPFELRFQGTEWTVVTPKLDP